MDSKDIVSFIFIFMLFILMITLASCGIGKKMEREKIYNNLLEKGIMEYDSKTGNLIWIETTEK